EDQRLAKQLREQVKLIDVFLSREVASGRLQKRFEANSPEILIHGHCHQKAQYGTQAMKAVLAGTQKVKEIPSGCCGMAGSFGYEKEHYALSEKIGESILFPAVRNMDAGTTLVANGFSCRHQIEHFTGITARHWLEVVRVTEDLTQGL